MNQLQKYLLPIRQGGAIAGFILVLSTMVFGEDVFVTNTPATPVPVQDIDNRIAVQGECDFKLPDGTSTSGDVSTANPCLISVIPLTKKLVIEFVTARVNLPKKQVPYLIIQGSSEALEGGTIQRNHQIALSVGPRTVASRHSYLATHMVRIYGMPGANFVIIGSRDGSATGEAQFVVTWAGYLVDAP